MTDEVKKRKKTSSASTHRAIYFSAGFGEGKATVKKSARN